MTRGAYSPDGEHLGCTCSWRAVFCLKVDDVVLLEVQASRQLDPRLRHQRRKSLDDLRRHSLAVGCGRGYHGVIKAWFGTVFIGLCIWTLGRGRGVVVLGVINGVVRRRCFDGV